MHSSCAGCAGTLPAAKHTHTRHPCLQASAWTPGVYEEQQRAAGLRPYRGEPNGLWRDRNVRLK